MSCFYLPKKLKQLPSTSKKAWNSFTSSLSPKFHNLRSHSLPTSLTRTASRLFDLRLNKRRRSIPRPQSARRARAFYHYKQYNYQHLQPYSSVPNSPATVYVDRLFGESLPSTSMSKETTNINGVTTEASTTSGSTIQDRRDGGGSGSGSSSGGGEAKKRKKVEKNNWKEYVSSMPNIKGVDERADEFISKFRQEMQIQREQSIIEFQEMLARSA